MFINKCLWLGANDFFCSESGVQKAGIRHKCIVTCFSIDKSTRLRTKSNISAQGYCVRLSIEACITIMRTGRSSVEITVIICFV